MQFNNNCLLNSWFNSRYNKIFNFGYYHHLNLSNDNIYQEQLQRCRKIKLKLSIQQKQQISQWESHSRYSYNRTVWYMNEITEQLSRNDIRDIVVLQQYNQDKPWLLETPKTIREGAVFEAYKNRKACITQGYNNTRGFDKENYQQYYMKKKNTVNKFSIHISHEAINRIPSQVHLTQQHQFEQKKFSLFSRITNFTIHTREKLPDQFGQQDCKLHFDGINYFLIVPIMKNTININNREKVCSLDPGIRVFQTLYNPIKDYYIRLGRKSGSSILHRLKILDNLISQQSQNQTQRRERLILKLRQRIKNLQKEQHDKIANYLCSNYSTIIIGDFKTKEVSKKQRRVLSTKNVRKMNTLAHRIFLERLKNKAQEYRCNVIVQNEKWTSKKCCRCGRIKRNLGGNSIYNCLGCRLRINRDLNGAINILQKQQGHLI